MEPAIAPIAMPIFAPVGSPSLSPDVAILVCEADGWLLPSIVVALGCPFTLFDPVMEAAVDRDVSSVDIAGLSAWQGYADLWKCMSDIRVVHLAASADFRRLCFSRHMWRARNGLSCSLKIFKTMPKAHSTDCHSI